jgi:hypothetical protein
MDPELDDDTDLGADAADGGDDGDGYEAKLGQLIVAVLHDDTLDLKAKRKKILKALQLLDEPADAAGDDDEDDDEPTDLDDAGESDGTDAAADELSGGNGAAAESVRLFRTHHDPAVRRLAERFDRLRAKQRLRSRRAKVVRLCERAQLPPALLSDLFLEQLLHAPDERAVRALIEDRRRLSGVRLPRSAAAGAGGPMGVREFADQLRRGA